MFASFKKQKKILLLFNSILNLFLGAVRLGARYNYGSKFSQLKILPIFSYFKRPSTYISIPFHQLL